MDLGGDHRPTGVAVTPDGRQVYTANLADDSVSVIDAGTLGVVQTIPVGEGPNAFGLFIGPAPSLVEIPTLDATGLALLMLLVSGCALAKLRSLSWRRPFARENGFGALHGSGDRAGGSWVAAQRSRTDHQHPADPSTKQYLGQDQPCLDRLAEPDIVGQQE